MNKVRQYFDEKALDWNESKDEKYLNDVLKDVVIDKDNKVLDLACGTGVISNILQKRSNAKLLAIDLSENMISRAKKKNKNPFIEFLCCDFYQLKESDFDVIVCFNAYPHFLVVEDFIKKCSEILKKNGKLYIVHDCGRLELNRHHLLHASHVSRMLLPVDTEAKLFSQKFAILSAKEDENSYFIELIKK